MLCFNTLVCFSHAIISIFSSNFEANKSNLYDIKRKLTLACIHSCNKTLNFIHPTCRKPEHHSSLRRDHPSFRQFLIQTSESWLSHRDETQKNICLSPQKWVSRRPFTRQRSSRWPDRCLGSGWMQPMEALSIRRSPRRTSPLLRYGSPPVSAQVYRLTVTVLHCVIPSIIYPYVLLSLCVGVWHWTRPWALFLWWQEKSGLHPLLQVQKEASIQSSPFHRVQWEHSLPYTWGGRGRGGRVWRRRGRVQADGGGEGGDEGGVRGGAGGSGTADWAR